MATAVITSSLATIDREGRLTLPSEIRSGFTSDDEFVVLRRGDELVLKKVHRRPSLEELVPGDTAEITAEDLEEIIQEVRGRRP